MDLEIPERNEADELKKWKRAQKTLVESQEALGIVSAETWEKLLSCICELKKVYKPYEDSEESDLPICRTIFDELKYAYIFSTLGSMCHFCYKNNISCNECLGDKDKCRNEVNRIFKTIMEKVLKDSKEKMPNEYETIKDRLIDEWNIYEYPDDIQDPRDAQALALKRRIEKLTRDYPLSAIHRKNLGDFYLYNESNYPLARDEFNRALLLDPDDSKIRFKIGVTYIRDAEQYPDRIDLLKYASDYLSQALDLCTDDIYKIRILYWLGYLSILRRDKEQIINFFKTAQLMAKTNHLDKDEGLFITHELANAYLDSKKYKKAELEFDDLIKKLPKDISLKMVGKRLGKDETNLDIAAMARLNLASFYIDREISLDKASLLLDEACYIIRNIKDDDKRSIFKALFFACKGWLKFKKYRMLNRPLLDVSDAGKISCVTINSTIEFPIFSLKEAFIVPAEGASAAKLKRMNDKKYMLINALLKNVKIPELIVGSSKLKNIVIDRIAIKKAVLDDMCFIKYDKIADSVMVCLSNWGLKECKLGEIDRQITYIERASISNAIVSGLIADRIDIQSAQISASTIDLWLINEAIKDLKHSIELYSDPKIYYYLAVIYEFRMRDEKDDDKRAILKEMALEACQNAIDADRLAWLG